MSEWSELDAISDTKQTPQIFTSLKTGCCILNINGNFSVIFDFILHIDVHLGEIIARYGILSYGIIFAIIFAETGLVFTPLLPGDSLLFAAGVFQQPGLLILLFCFYCFGTPPSWAIRRITWWDTISAGR